MVHLIELKFVMYIIGHRPTKCIDFGELRISSFFLQEHKINSYTLQAMESNYKKYASVYAVLSIKLKFNKYIVDDFFSYCINFGVSRRYSLFTGYTKCHALLSAGPKYLRTFQYLLESVQN